MLALDQTISTSPPAFVLPYVYQLPMDNRPRFSSTSSIGSNKLFIHLAAQATNPRQLEHYHIIICDDNQPLDIKITQNDSLQLEKQKYTAAAQPIAFVDQLNPIRDRLALSITQMAELFGVTRKSVYDWYEGVEPRAATAKRMESLIDALGTIPVEADLHRLKVIWNIPVSGQSFRAVFNNDNLDNDSLLTELKTKLNELFPRMVKKTSSLCKTTTQLGEAHLAEFDRHADFS